MQIPEGYQLLEFVDPFEERVGPLCFKVDEAGRMRFAFEASSRHANSSGQIHGGMLMTFADFALCLVLTSLLDVLVLVVVAIGADRDVMTFG